MYPNFKKYICSKNQGLVTSHLMANKDLHLMDKVHMVLKGKEETLMDNRVMLGRRAVDMVVATAARHKEEMVMDSKAPTVVRVLVDMVVARGKEVAAMEDGVKVRVIASCVDPDSTFKYKMRQIGPCWSLGWNISVCCLFTR